MEQDILYVGYTDGWCEALRVTLPDEQTVLAENKVDVSYMLRKLAEEYTKRGLEINASKTEYSVCLLYTSRCV